MLEKLKGKKFLLLLTLINLVAGFYSISYYFWQFEKTNPLFWIFIIDCPLYSIIFGINLFLIAKEKTNPLLGFVSIVGSLKYGIWTIFALLLPGLFFAFPILVVGHLLLIFEVILLYKMFSFKIKHFIIVLLWFLINDILDYFVGIHPYFEPQFFNEIMIFSFISTFVLAFLVAIIFEKKANTRNINNPSL